MKRIWTSSGHNEIGHQREPRPSKTGQAREPAVQPNGRTRQMSASESLLREPGHTPGLDPIAARLVLPHCLRDA